MKEETNVFLAFVFNLDLVCKNIDYIHNTRGAINQKCTSAVKSCTYIKQQKSKKVYRKNVNKSVIDQSKKIF